jgi:chemotaxis protein methyltransferase CheR
VTPNEFSILRAFLRKRSGLVLSDDKRYLAESRLKPLLTEFRLASFSHLVGGLGQPRQETLTQRVTEAMTVNETFFFRDQLPFDQLVNMMLPALTASGASPRRLRIWCAACSTGQEPYSIAIALRELGRKYDPWSFEILATDLSSDVVARARSGTYSQFDVQRGMPAHLLARHFTQKGSEWEAKPELKSMISFRNFNLMEPCRSLGMFDIVFCRNVLIYFDADTKRKIVEGIGQQIRHGGYFVLGGSESLLGVTDALSAVENARSVYRPASANHGAAGKTIPASTRRCVA